MFEVAAFAAGARHRGLCGDRVRNVEPTVRGDRFHGNDRRAVAAFEREVTIVEDPDLERAVVMPSMVKPAQADQVRQLGETEIESVPNVVAVRSLRRHAASRIPAAAVAGLERKPHPR